MNIGTRAAVGATVLAAVLTPLAVAAQPAAASHGKPTNCVKVPTTYPGIVTKQTFAAGEAGTVTLRRDAVNDGLIVGAVTVNPGWTKSGTLRQGPRVHVDFDGATSTIQLEAAQSAQYYGPDILVVEIKTCSKS